MQSCRAGLQNRINSARQDATTQPDIKSDDFARTVAVFMYGRGKFQFENGDFYDGEWRGGLRHGSGTFRFNNGDVYEGQFSHDWQTNGQHTFVDGGTYEGSWVKNRRHGFGKQAWPSGTVYIGHFANDKKHGFGKVVYADGGKCLQLGCDWSWCAGDVFEGYFQDDVRHGACSYRFFNGDTFAGTWTKGQCPEFTECQRLVLLSADPQVAAIAHTLKTMQLKVARKGNCI